MCMTIYLYIYLHTQKHQCTFLHDIINIIDYYEENVQTICRFLYRDRFPWPDNVMDKYLFRDVSSRIPAKEIPLDERYLIAAGLEDKGSGQEGGGGHVTVIAPIPSILESYLSNILL